MELSRLAPELLGIDETQALVDALSRAAPALVREVVPRRIELATLRELLRRLLEEGIGPSSLRELCVALAATPPGH